MPGFKGKTRFEFKEAEWRDESERPGDSTAVFKKAIPQLKPAETLGLERPRALDLFLKLGESAPASSETPKPPVIAQTPTQPGLWQSLRNVLAAMGGGLGAPFMIFSFLLFPGRDFARSIANLNLRLREYDEALALREAKAQLTPAQEKLILDPKMHQLSEQRVDLVTEYQHHLKQARQQPQVLLRQEITRIFDERKLRHPQEAFIYLAHKMDLNEEIYLGALLKTATVVDFEAWVMRHRPKPGDAEQEHAFKSFVIDWLRVHLVRAGIPRLRNYLRDDDPQIRVMAARALLRFGETSKALPTLSKIALRSPSANARLEAVEALRERESREATLVFREMALDERLPPELRVEAVEALANQGEMGFVKSTRQLFELWKERADAAKSIEGDSLWELYHALRCAAALRKLGQPLDSYGLFQDFLKHYDPEPQFLNSKLLEETLTLYAAAEGPKSQPLLLALAKDARWRPELRSGAILALGRNLSSEISRDLMALLSDRKEEAGLRIAALEVLSKTPVPPAELLKWALELVQSKRLFVRLRAIDLLIDFKGGETAQAFLVATQRVSRKVLQDLSIAALEEGQPFAHHEQQAYFEMDEWFIRAKSRLDPDWQTRLTSVDFATVKKMIEEEARQRERFAIPEEIEAWLREDFDWKNLKTTQQDSLHLVGLTLSKGILSMAEPGSAPLQTLLELLRGLRSDAVQAIAHTARQDIRGVKALLTLHEAQNPHALPTLLQLDIQFYLRSAGSDPAALSVLSELASLGHHGARAVYKKGWN